MADSTGIRYEPGGCTADVGLFVVVVVVILLLCFLGSSSVHFKMELVGNVKNREVLLLKIHIFS